MERKTQPADVQNLPDINHQNTLKMTVTDPDNVIQSKSYTTSNYTKYKLFSIGWKTSKIS